MYEGTDNVSNDTALRTVRQKISQNDDGRFFYNGAPLEIMEYWSKNIIFGHHVT